MKKILQIGIVGICLFSILGIFFFCFINELMIVSTEDYSFLEDTTYSPADCILILGAGVRDKEPTPMLKDRLEKGISLYHKGYAKKIIMSGDHGREDYDEVNVMKNYAIEKGVSSEDIFMDHAGFSTYDSIYRAKKIFEVDKMFVVSQKYHLYRAIYLAKCLGIEAIAVSAEDVSYRGQMMREYREFLARNKDFWKGIFLPPSTYLGKIIPVTGDGNVTND